MVQVVEMAYSRCQVTKTRSGVKYSMALVWQLERIGPDLQVKYLMADGTSKYLHANVGDAVHSHCEQTMSSRWSSQLARVLEIRPRKKSFDMDGLKIAEWKYGGERVLVVECTDKQHPLMPQAVNIMANVLMCNKRDIDTWSIAGPAALDNNDLSLYDLATARSWPYAGLRVVGVTWVVA